MSEEVSEAETYRSRRTREAAMNKRVDDITQLLREMRGRMEALEASTSGRRERRPRREEHHDNHFYDHEYSSDENQPRRPPARRHDDDLRGMKLCIPPFYGKNDPDAFLEWEKKAELVFDCQHFSDRKKISLAATAFHNYAIDWWDQIVTNRRRNRENPVETWTEMIYLMRRRFVPTHYHRELHQRLRALNQGSKCVEDYFQEMEKLMLKGNIDESHDATMARFLAGMN